MVCETVIDGYYRQSVFAPGLFFRSDGYAQSGAESELRGDMSGNPVVTAGMEMRIDFYNGCVVFRVSKHERRS